MPCRLVWETPGVDHWVSQMIGAGSRGFGECRTASVIKNGDFIAGVVFHNWSPECQTIEVSAAAITPRWVTRGILAELFEYPFQTAGCRMAVSRTAENNMRVRKLWLAFGATEHLLPDLRADGEAECVSLLKKEAWKESRLNNG